MKQIIIREYLQSLKESEELDAIFPILLESMDFRILSKPIQSKGLQQYGKDVVAIGIDPIDNNYKRFYFEIKGGSDRDITTNNYSKTDGIRESIIEAKDRQFTDSSIPGFDNLPVKILLVHNGELKHNVKEPFDGFIANEFPVTRRNITYEFERWDIIRLSELFGLHLFNEYLLSTEEQVDKFKRVLVFLNNPESDFTDLYSLIDDIIDELNIEDVILNRKQKSLFQSLRLIAYIVFSYAKEANNLEPAKRALPYIILRFWSWIIKNNLHTNEQIKAHFGLVYEVYLNLLNEYYVKLFPVAKLKHGLLEERYLLFEQVGYPIRVFEFLSYSILFYNYINSVNNPEVYSNSYVSNFKDSILEVIQNNVCSRPLIDIHSVPIFLIWQFIYNTNQEAGKKYLSDVFESIWLGYNANKRLPNSNNNVEGVIRYIITGKKNVFYNDNTSHLLGILFELLAVCDMKDEYYKNKKVVLEIGVDIAVFIPFNNKELINYLSDSAPEHEILLFTKTINEEGFQSEVILDEDFDKFKEKTLNKNEFTYHYLTTDAQLDSLLTLAHIFYRTPFFPNYWRNQIAL
jgi:hypothetical protein